MGAEGLDRFQHVHLATIRARAGWVSLPKSSPAGTRTLSRKNEGRSPNYYRAVRHMQKTQRRAKLSERSRIEKTLGLRFVSSVEIESQDCGNQSGG